MRCPSWAQQRAHQYYRVARSKELCVNEKQDTARVAFDGSMTTSTLQERETSRPVHATRESPPLHSPYLSLALQHCLVAYRLR